MAKRLLILTVLMLLAVGCAQTGSYRQYREKHPKPCPCETPYGKRSEAVDKSAFQLVSDSVSDEQVREFFRDLLYWPVTCVWSIPQALKNSNRLDVLS